MKNIKMIKKGLKWQNKILAIFLLLFVAMICCSMVSAANTDNHADDIGASADTGMTAQETDITEDIQTVDESPKNTESTEKSIQKNTIQNVKEEEPIQNWDDIVREVENAKTNNVNTTITDETGALLITNTKLAIKINGKTILNGVNSTNGKIDVSFATTLRPGMYELQIISGENGIYKTGKMTTA